MSKWVFEQKRDGRKTRTDVEDCKWPKFFPSWPAPLLSWRSESGFVHVIFFCQWDISKHDTDACALGIALFLLYETLQLPPCVWAQANLLDERNVSNTLIDTVPPARHGSKASKTNWSTNHQTCEWSQPSSANLTQKSCPESLKYHERSL